MRDAGAQVRPDHATARRSEGDAPSRCLGNGRKRSISAAPLQNTRQTDLVGSLGLKSDRLLAQPSPWPQAPVREQQREAKRNAVLSTAAQMFNERGFHATSLDDIAARLQVSKPTLYYYVKNKDEILLECVKKGLHLILEGIEASRQAGGNAVDQLRACMQVYADIVTQPFGMCIIRIGDEEVPEPSRTELRRMKSEIDQAFRRLVAQGVQEGTLAPCDPKMTAFVIAGALSWIGRWYQSGGEYTAAQVAEQCIGTLMHGVLGPGRVAAAGR